MRHGGSSRKRRDSRHKHLRASLATVCIIAVSACSASAASTSSTSAAQLTTYDRTPVGEARALARQNFRREVRIPYRLRAMKTTSLYGPTTTVDCSPIITLSRYFEVGASMPQLFKYLRSHVHGPSMNTGKNTKDGGRSTALEWLGFYPSIPREANAPRFNAFGYTVGPAAEKRSSLLRIDSVVEPSNGQCVSAGGAAPAGSPPALGAGESGG